MAIHNELHSLETELRELMDRRDELETEIDKPPSA